MVAHWGYWLMGLDLALRATEPPLRISRLSAVADVYDSHSFGADYAGFSLKPGRVDGYLPFIPDDHSRAQALNVNLTLREREHKG